MTAEEWAAMTSYEQGVIYRVAGETSYADWMYNGTTIIKMAEYDNAIDEEPTPNSDNLVKSGGVFEVVKSDSTPIVRISEIRSNTYVNISGEITNHNSFDCPIFSVEPGKYYLVSGSFPAGTTVYLVSWFDANEGFISFAPPKGASTQKIFTDVEVMAPANAAFAFINVWHSREVMEPIKEANGGILRTSDLSESVSNDLSKIATDMAKKTRLHPDSVISDSYIGRYNQIYTSTNYNILRYSVTGGDYYAFSGRMPSGFKAAWLLAWYDSNNNMIAHEPYIGSTSEVRFTDVVVRAPQNAAYALHSVAKTQQNYFHRFYSLDTIQGSDLFSDTRETKAAISASEVMTPVITEGYITDKDGNRSANNNNDEWKYTVEGGKPYLFSGRKPTGSTVPFLVWLDANSVFVDAEPYEGSMSETVTYENKFVVAPFNASYAVMNVHKDNIRFYNMSSIGESIRTEDVINYVDEKSDETNGKIDAVERSLCEFVESIPVGTAGGFIKPDGSIDDSNPGRWELRKYAVEGDKDYVFSGATVTGNSGVYVIYWMDENEQVISYDYKTSGTEDMFFKDEPIHSPANAAYLWMNTRTILSGYFHFGVIGESLDLRNMKPKDGDMKVVLKVDGTFYLRFHIDDENDGILTIGYYNAYAFKEISLMHRRFFVGGRSLTDDEILEQYNDGDYHDCYDTLSSLKTMNLGPLYNNHGLCTPRVTIANHNLTSADVGSRWIDQLNRDYTIVLISGNNVYLMPVIHSTGVPGEETRGWADYDAPAITSIRRDAAGGETLTVGTNSRYDWQVSELKNIKILVDGAEKPVGTYYCKEVSLSYEQLGYNPIHIQTWRPRPVYDGVDLMAIFRRQLVYTGCDGFLSVCMGTTLDIRYPAPLDFIAGIGLMLPTAFKDGYDSFIGIPKTKIEAFQQEFISNTKSGTSVNVTKNADDLDLSNFPDRAYAYLKHENDGSELADTILMGVAGGVSMLRGISRSSVRSANIGNNYRVARWSPSSGNKYYMYIIKDDRTIQDTFLGDYESFMCWYKPENDVQSFFYKEGNEYILYIHTKSVHAKEAVKVPSLMNGLSVKSVVEQSSNNISYLNDIIVDGKLYINSGSDYEYIVLKIG